MLIINIMYHFQAKKSIISHEIETVMVMCIVHCPQGSEVFGRMLKFLGTLKFGVFYHPIMSCNK